MKKIISLLLAVFMAVGMVGLCASCGSSTTAAPGTTTPGTSGTPSAPAQTDLDYVKSKGKLVVGIMEYAPMDYKDENDNWTGFDAEFARLFADKLGVTAEFIVIDWDNKLFELSSGAIDCIWNGMTITDEILNSCAVSDAYVKNQQVVVMSADKAAEYATFDDMVDLSFAAEAGSAGESAVSESVANYTAVSDQSTALMEVASGSVDACVIDATMAAAMTGDGTSYADLVVAAELTNEEYGVAFRQNSDLCDEFNKVMNELIADGTLGELAAKYGLTLAK